MISETISSGLADFAFLRDADDWDANGSIPKSALRELASRGILDLCVCASESGGEAWSALADNIKSVGQGSASMLSVLTVNLMAAAIIARFASPDVKRSLLDALRTGNILCSVAFSEEAAGSDLRNIKTVVESNGQGLTVSGGKQWISAAQYADIFLVLARKGRQVGFVAIERGQSGLELLPTTEMTAFRSAGIARIAFDHCSVRPEYVFGFSDEAMSFSPSVALLAGRFSIAWGAVGAMDRCCELAFQRAKDRKVFGEFLYKMDLTRRKLALLRVNRALGLAMCEKMTAAWEADSREKNSLTLISKYACARQLKESADITAELHGALAFGSNRTVERIRRDSAVFGIIEGTSDVIELNIGSPFGALC